MDEETDFNYEDKGSGDRSQKHQLDKKEGDWHNTIAQMENSHLVNISKNLP